MKTICSLLLLVLAATPVPFLAQDEPLEVTITRESPPAAADVQLTTIASGLDRPLYLTNADDGTDRLFVLEQTGKIWILRRGRASRRSIPRCFRNYFAFGGPSI